jgi:hypothetical protein
VKGLITLLALAALATPAQAHDRPEHRCTVQDFRPFSAAVWDRDLWERGQPPARTIRAQRNRLGCAPPAHRQAMKRTWRAGKRAYFEFRAAMLFRQRYTPYACGSGWYALPCAVTECESGFYFGHHSGAYGLLDSTWVAWNGGRFAPYPGAATPAQQAIIATEVWNDVGPSGWSCA